MADRWQIRRVELIDHTAESEFPKGRVYSVAFTKPVTVEVDLQDQGQTLKIFISDEGRL